MIVRCDTTGCDNMTVCYTDGTWGWVCPGCDRTNVFVHNAATVLADLTAMRRYVPPTDPIVDDWGCPAYAHELADRATMVDYNACSGAGHMHINRLYRDTQWTPQFAVTNGGMTRYVERKLEQHGGFGLKCKQQHPGRKR